MMMRKRYTWKKGTFSDTFKIYANNRQSGKLKNKTFSQTATGEINGKNYTYKTKGFFRQHTEIIDDTNGSVIGEISYNDWMTKAFISLDKKEYTWKYDNHWNTKWSIKSFDRVLIKYRGSSTGGEIDPDVDDDLLLLTGLFVTNYYWQATLFILIAVFSIIILSN
jgi:hypothetical protein